MSALDLAVLATTWGAVAAHVLVADRGGLLVALRPGLLARVLALNLVLLPLAAAGAAALLVPDPAHAAGIVLYGAASAGAVGIAMARLGRGDLSFALPLVVILELASAVSLPAWSAVFLPRGIDPPVGDVAGVVLRLILLPALLAIAIRTASPRLAARLVRPAEVAAGLGLAGVLLMVVARDGPLLLDALRSGIPAAAALLVAAGIAGGWVAAGGGAAMRTTAALVSAQRGATLAFAVATTAFADAPGTAAAVVVTAVLTLLAVGAAAVGLRRVPARLRDAPPAATGVGSRAS